MHTVQASLHLFIPPQGWQILSQRILRRSIVQHRIDAFVRLILTLQCRYQAIVRCQTLLISQERILDPVPIKSLPGRQIQICSSLNSIRTKKQQYCPDKTIYLFHLLPCMSKKTNRTGRKPETQHTGSLIHICKSHLQNKNCKGNQIIPTPFIRFLICPALYTFAPSYHIHTPSFLYVGFQLQVICRIKKRTFLQ